MTKDSRLYGLDHLRAIAIIMVFFYHYPIVSGGQPSWLPGLVRFGWTGVDLFFVLSGFLIASQLFDQIRKAESISLRDFFLKRFFRIIPAYWVTLAIYFLVPAFRERESLPPLWKFVTFTQNLGLDLKNAGTFSHAWSLCVEEHFYLLLPLTLWLLLRTKSFKRSALIIAVLFLFGFFIRAWCFNHFYLTAPDTDNPWISWYKYIYYPSYSRLDGLLAGVSLAALQSFKPALWQKIAARGNVLVVLSVMILLAASFVSSDEMSFTASVFGFPLVDIGYGLLVAGVISPGNFLFNRRSKVTTIIASLSFGIYLTHKGIIHVTLNWLKGYHLNDNVKLLICMATCFIVARILFELVEKPMLRLRKRFV